ncbi:hypothetical protein HMN09_00928400 [Mycena chlorophos]|uniref:O-acetylhomoserine (Thiol)-lyase n=1 Tax=Mycena chlorophos TaxID=658473 RepID=A0A8H6SLF3_MYCCL|nr:hypothetical protein HMN09_00928400 [Mycena chlorophos]
MEQQLSSEHQATAVESASLFREPDFETLQLHAGHDFIRTPDDPTSAAQFGASNPRAVPIFQSVAYGFRDVQHGIEVCALREPGYVYSRVANPTISVFEKRMAALEGGAEAVATASGMAAITLTLTALAAPGGEVITASRLYGGTYQLFKNTLPRLSIRTIFVPTLSPADFAAQITDKTRAIFLETMANSDLGVPDIAAFAALANEHGIPLVVDNTFGMGGGLLHQMSEIKADLFGGYIVQPIKLGAHIVGAATKWIGGHGTSLGGVIIDSGTFDWRKSTKFPAINGPASAYNDVNLAETFHPTGFATHVRADLLRDLGSCLTPLNAFLMLQGLETLSLRAERHCANALALATYLSTHPNVFGVRYVGLPTHPCHDLAKKIFRKGLFGGIVTFRVVRAVGVVNKARLASNLANIGDAKTLIIAPYAIVQGQITQEERASGGVYEDTIRISVGIESIDDIIADLRGALDAAFSDQE